MYNSSVCAVLVSEELEDPIIVEDNLAGDHGARDDRHNLILPTNTGVQCFITIPHKWRYSVGLLICIVSLTCQPSFVREDYYLSFLIYLKSCLQCPI